MKILTNLATAPDPRERYALAWAVPVTVGAMAVLIYFSIGIVQSIAHYRTYHKGLLEFQSQAARWNQNEKALRGELEQPQYQKAFHLAKYVNGLIARREFSMSELMEKVTELLPPNVRLGDLSFSPGSEPVVRVTVAGQDQAAVESFLTHLEDSDDFRDVTVLSSGQGGEPTISCTALYVGGATR